MRCAQEDDAKRREVYGAVDTLVRRAPQVVRVEQRALDEDPAEAVAHPDDGVARRALADAELRQAGHECLGVLVDEVVACAAGGASRVHVCVVPIHHDIGWCHIA